MDSSHSTKFSPTLSWRASFETCSRSASVFAFTYGHKMYIYIISSNIRASCSLLVSEAETMFKFKESAVLDHLQTLEILLQTEQFRCLIKNVFHGIYAHLTRIYNVLT